MRGKASPRPPKRCISSDGSHFPHCLLTWYSSHLSSPPPSPSGTEMPDCSKDPSVWRPPSSVPSGKGAQLSVSPLIMCPVTHVSCDPKTWPRAMYPREPEPSGSPAQPPLTGPQVLQIDLREKFPQVGFWIQRENGPERLVEATRLASIPVCYF